MTSVKLTVFGRRKGVWLLERIAAEPPNQFGYKRLKRRLRIAASAEARFLLTSQRPNSSRRGVPAFLGLLGWSVDA